MTIDESYDRRQAMVNLVQAAEHIDLAKLLLCGCSVDHLRPDDPVVRKCKRLYGVLCADAVRDIEGGDSRLFDLRVMAATVTQGATETEQPTEAEPKPEEPPKGWPDIEGGEPPETLDERYSEASESE